VEKAAQLIYESERPLILAGHGVIIAQAFYELQELAEKANIPVITTLLGISGFPPDHPLYLGMPGMHALEQLGHLGGRPAGGHRHEVR
jgi:acetolactate synthase-1/2/3 large subunit